MVKTVKTKKQFEKELEKAKAKLIVVDFTASWCGQCRTIAPVFESLSRQFRGVVFLKVDVTASPDLAFMYRVRSMPTFVFIQDFRKVATINLGTEKALERHLMAL